MLLLDIRHSYLAIHPFRAVDLAALAALTLALHAAAAAALTARAAPPGGFALLRRLRSSRSHAAAPPPSEVQLPRKSPAAHARSGSEVMLVAVAVEADEAEEGPPA